MMSDLRFVLRSLAAQPTFSAVALLTLALGLGANVAIFSVVNAVLLRPLPYERADRLVTVWQDLTRRGGPPDEWASPGNLADWQAATDVFASLAAGVNWSPSLTTGDAPEPLTGAQVTADYFTVLAARFAVGRAFDPGEDVPNAPRVVILGHDVWMRRFDGDRGIVGRAIELSGDPHVVVGVLERGFRPAIVSDAEVFRPLRLNLATPSRGLIVLRVVGWLADGITIDEARDRMARVARALETTHPQSHHGAGIAIVGLHEQTVGDVRSSLLVLFGAVSLVLLVACANVASLFLARGLARDREIAVRRVLGASRFRLVRLLLMESAVVSAGGGLIGILVAVWSLQALIPLAPVRLPRLDEIAIDGRVLGFAALASCATAMVFGLVPALRLSRGDGTVLKDGHRTTAAARGLRRALVVIEVAMAVMLLVGAGLMVRSFSKLLTFDLGFDRAHVVAGRLLPAPVRYANETRLTALYDAVLDAAASIPGVRAAALTSIVPFDGDTDMSFEIAGRPVPARDDQLPVAWYRAVSSGYFDVMGVPVTSGRGFDAREPSPVVIVNDTMARRYWPGTDPLNQRVRTGPGAPWFTVVGVGGDMRSRGPRAPLQAEMFVPYHHLPERSMWVLLRTAPGGSGDAGAAASGAVSPESVMTPLRRVVQRLDPTLPVSPVTTMDDMAAGDLAQARFLATLTSLFGVLALALAGFGIYGVMAYMVSRRRVEIGVRMALGAGASDVLRLIVGESVTLAALGLAAGAVASLPLARAIETQLFQTAPTDPIAFVAAAGVLFGVALMASIVPARRAIGIAPHQALRSE